MLDIALYFFGEAPQARIFLLLLAVDAEEERLVRAITNFDDGHLLHFGAHFCYPADVSALLGAGVDEAMRDSEGCIPRDVIGVDLGRNSERQMSRRKKLKVHRMLQRGPEYRARSWTWPAFDKEAEAGGRVIGGTAAPAAAAAEAAAAAAILSTLPATTPAPPFWVCESPPFRCANFPAEGGEP